ncbi:aminotransferase class III-fold pyridoxal phosphate-dependent enzyme [Rhodobacteraceae bacterium nBUS_22]|jgi:glutamate-1-semialdehyde aminotransferase
MPKLGKGQRLWNKAKTIIPGGNMLLSKRPEMFLPDQWPAYYSRAEGARIWDMDGNEYVDMSIMGIGANVLGYAHPKVDEAVRNSIGNGNLATLNAPEEVALAERLVELHPWADMARFARTGGEANAIAIRIARAASGRDNVAICGYHGWHDWYLATNLGDSGQLDEHLLPGLDPTGVPSTLSGSTFPFQYNDFDGLAKLAADQNIGVIQMEVMRTHPPTDSFLQKVRDLATDRGIVLIFDECTSGFRQNFGGLHLEFDVAPDMAVYGKALGNGYAVTAVLGRRDVMQAAQSTFISSTFWTERIGSVAALATLDVMEAENPWGQILATGHGITKRWTLLAQKYDLPLVPSGIPSLTSFTFSSPNNLAYKSLITQSMLDQGFLAANSVYVCTAHTPKMVDAYFDCLEPLFALIQECEQGRDVSSLLNGPVCHSGFSRLN